jgi:hypothetical protein
MLPTCLVRYLNSIYARKKIGRSITLWFWNWNNSSEKNSKNRKKKQLAKQKKQQEGTSVSIPSTSPIPVEIMADQGDACNSPIFASFILLIIYVCCVCNYTGSFRRLFPHSLIGKANEWYLDQPTQVMTNWNTLEEKFLNRFFPHNRFMEADCMSSYVILSMFFSHFQ